MGTLAPVVKAGQAMLLLLSCLLASLAPSLVLFTIHPLYHSTTALPAGWRVLGGLGVPGPAGVPGRLVRGPLCRVRVLRGPGPLHGTVVLLY